MARSIFFITMTFLCMGLYTALHFYAIPLNNPKAGNCRIELLNKFLPWSAGCFYSAYFVEEPDLEMLEFEHQRLNVFAQKNGAAKHIRWYRSVFYRRFDSTFNLNDALLLEIHKSAIEVNPNRMSEVVSFLKYMTDKGNVELAQGWLDEYCDIYVPAHRDFIIVSLRAIMKKSRVRLSLDYCRTERGSSHST